eukprot:scaffold1192_cov179-Ochromonas_danica.AAC.5
MENFRSHRPMLHNGCWADISKLEPYSSLYIELLQMRKVSSRPLTTLLCNVNTLLDVVLELFGTTLQPSH